MTRRARPLLLLVCLGAAAAAPAQPVLGRQGPDATPPGTAGAPTPVAPPQWQEFDVYAVATSRALFAACDGNGDDRLSIFEAVRTIENFGSLRQPERFRQLDRDADGYLEWPEFDRRFRELTENGSPLRVRPVRTLPLEAGADLGLDRARARGLLQVLDADADGVVSATEANALAGIAGLPVDGGALFRQLDRDGDARVTVEELMLVARGFRLPEPRPAPPVTPLSLPVAYRDADLDGDGGLTLPELEVWLRRFDAGLARWSRRILADADQNGSGTLGTVEIQRCADGHR
jgi:Ca2+-binding EF-hand superfamily protein